MKMKRVIARAVTTTKMTFLHNKPSPPTPAEMPADRDREQERRPSRRDWSLTTSRQTPRPPTPGTPTLNRLKSWTLINKNVGHCLLRAEAKYLQTRGLRQQRRKKLTRPKCLRKMTASCLLFQLGPRWSSRARPARNGTWKEGFFSG